MKPGRKGRRPKQSEEAERWEMSGFLCACERTETEPTALAELRRAGRGERREAASTLPRGCVRIRLGGGCLLGCQVAVPFCSLPTFPPAPASAPRGSGGVACPAPARTVLPRGPPPTGSPQPFRLRFWAVVWAQAHHGPALEADPVGVCQGVCATDLGRNRPSPPHCFLRPEPGFPPFVQVLCLDLCGFEEKLWKLRFMARGFSTVPFCSVPQPPVRMPWSRSSPSCWPPDVPSLFMFIHWLGFPADLSSRPWAPHLPCPMQTPCAFPQWPGFPEPQVCAPGLVRTVSKASMVLPPSQPPAKPAGSAGRAWWPGSPSCRRCACITPGALPSGPTWRPPQAWSQLSFAAAPWHCPQDRPTLARPVPVVPSHMGRGFYGRPLHALDPVLGNGIWHGGPGLPPRSRPSPFLPAVDAACRDFVCTSFRPRRGLRRKPSVGTHGDVASGGFRGFQSPPSLFVGRQSPRLDSASGSFPSLFSVRGSAASISLALTADPWNRGARVWPHWRLLCPRLLSSLWRWFVFDPGPWGWCACGPPLGAWCRGAHVSVPLCSWGPWPWSRGCPLFFRDT